MPPRSAKPRGQKSGPPAAPQSPVKAGHVLRLETPSPAKARSHVTADSPHSGRIYPRDFNHACARATLRQAEDAYLDRLFSFLPDIGIPFLHAQFPRSYIDPNRMKNSPTLIRKTCSPRHPDEIYKDPLTLSEVFNRVAHYYRPYHAALEKMVAATQDAQGVAVHLNLHSMPSTLQSGTKPNPYDIALGTRDGATCDPRLVAELKRLFEEKGYRVGIDVPSFKGAEILRRLGDPQNGRHAVQVEVNRKLYLDEEKVAVSKPPLRKMQADLRDIMQAFGHYCDHVTFAPPAMPAPKHHRK